MLAAPDWDVLSQLEEAKPCETPTMDCPDEASWAVWTLHHLLGCGSTSFRCDWHYNMLMLRVQRMVSRVERGEWFWCAFCGVLCSSQRVSDYVRGIRL